MIRRFACRRHRSALIDLVDRRERGPGTSAALDHLGVCGRCEREITELALTIAALRRAGVATRDVDTPAVARDRVLALTRGQPARRWGMHTQLGGLLIGATLVGLLAVPRLADPMIVGPGAESPVAADAAVQLGAGERAIAAGRIYEPPAQPLLADVVRGFIHGSSVSVVRQARLLPSAIDQPDQEPRPVGATVQPAAVVHQRSPT